MSTPRPRTAAERPGRIVAHRGASRAAPENTLAAFREARRQGVDWIEFDVTLLGDGTPVVHHDAVLGRCAAGEGPLSRLGRADLARIDAGSWFGPDFADEPLPTLETTLDLIEEADLFANLEIKRHEAPARLAAETVATALGPRGWAFSRVLVSSFDFEALAALRMLRPDQPLALVCHVPPDDWPERLSALGAAALHVRHTALSGALLTAAQAEGIDLRVFTVNEPDEIAAFRGTGLSGVITDDVPAFLGHPEWGGWARG